MKGMLLFWAILNLSDIRYLIVLWLIGVAISCFENTTLAFCYSLAIINPVVVAIFFQKTCKDIFNHLFKARSSNSGFFGPVLAHFRTVETNR